MRKQDVVLALFLTITSALAFLSLQQSQVICQTSLQTLTDKLLKEEELALLNHVA